ncbi:MAG: RAD55 family ATPase [Carbonactinosporaceae bacterium]
MVDRLSTGNTRLDEVLGGGLARDAINLIVGLPGTGKTILAQQCVTANADPGRRAVYLSTVSEPLEKILRYAQTLSFFDPGRVGDAIIYDELGTALGAEGLTGALEQLRALILQNRPGLLVIDGFKAMHSYARDAGDFRRFLHDLAGMLSAYPVTCLWLGEYAEDDIGAMAEFAVADAIIVLSQTQADERSARTVQVRKLRGGGFLSGKHAYRISSAGYSVFPRLADPTTAEDYGFDLKRVPSGIQALDDLLEDGYASGSAIMMAGPTGIGKTLMGLHFIFHGTRIGETGLIATLEENPAQLERIVRSYGWSLDDDNVALMYRSPVDNYMDEWVQELLDTIETTGARRVLIDSLNDLGGATSDPTRFREYLYSLLQRCSRRGISLAMTYEVTELFGLTRLSDDAISHLADTVLLLQYRLSGAKLARTITVLKTRASGHNPYVHEFQITPRGIVLAERPAGQVTPLTRDAAE